MANPVTLWPDLFDPVCVRCSWTLVLGRGPSDGNVWFQTVHIRLDANYCFDVACSHCQRRFTSHAFALMGRCMVFTQIPCGHTFALWQRSFALVQSFSFRYRSLHSGRSRKKLRRQCSLHSDRRPECLQVLLRSSVGRNVTEAALAMASTLRQPFQGTS